MEQTTLLRDKLVDISTVLDSILPEHAAAALKTKYSNFPTKIMIYGDLFAKHGVEGKYYIK